MIVRRTTPGGDDFVYLETKNEPINLTRYSNKYKNSLKVYGMVKWVAYNPYLELLTYMKHTAKGLFLMKMTLGNLRIVSQQKIKNQYDIQLPNGRKYNTRQVDLTPKEKDKKKKVYLFQMTNANGQVLWEKKTTSHRLTFIKFIHNERYVILQGHSFSKMYVYESKTGKKAIEAPVYDVTKFLHWKGSAISIHNGIVSTLQLIKGRLKKQRYKIGYSRVQGAWTTNSTLYFSNIYNPTLVTNNLAHQEYSTFLKTNARLNGVFFLSLRPFTSLVNGRTLHHP